MGVKVKVRVNGKEGNCFKVLSFEVKGKGNQSPSESEGGYDVFQEFSSVFIFGE
ncbi:MAG: hypothetical protein PHV51_08455 [Methanosarcinaceae archaeon]|nr:hypothetical protein [Methanosarcinaceae archaeon]